MEVAQHWRLNAQRYHLTGTVCEGCGAAHFPPRAVCSACAQAGGRAAQTPRLAQIAAQDAVRQTGPNGRRALRHTPSLI